MFKRIAFASTSKWHKPACSDGVRVQIRVPVRRRQTFRTGDPELVIKDRPRKPSSGDPLTEPLPKIWEDPWRYAFGDPPPVPEYTQVIESEEEWKYVERLMPIKTIPEPPKHAKYPTPSGWQPLADPAPCLPYYVRRMPDHTYPLMLQTRRDLLDPKSLEYFYVELVILKNIEGDVFACESDLRTFLEQQLGHKVATNVVEAQSKIFVKGADRSHLEAFLRHTGF